MALDWPEGQGAPKLCELPGLWLCGMQLSPERHGEKLLGSTRHSQILKQRLEKALYRLHPLARHVKRRCYACAARDSVADALWDFAKRSVSPKVMA